MTTLAVGLLMTSCGGVEAERVERSSSAEAALTLVDNGPARTFVVDGVVNALARSGTTLYLGGRFDYAGQRTGAWAALADADGLRDAAYPEFGGGSVFAIEADGSGGFFVGGSFTRVGALETSGLVHILADNTVDISFLPALNGPVYALARQGLALYVGGSFTSVNGMGRGRLAVFDTDTAVLTSIGWTGANGTVRSLALGGGVLYIGGDFSTLNAKTRRCLGAIDQGTGALVAWNPSPNGSLGRAVHAIVSDGAVVYVGGEFTTIGGQLRTRLAAIDAATGLATAWHADLGATASIPGVMTYQSVVETLTATASSVFVGGGYSTIGGISRRNLAEIDKSTGAITTFDPSPDGRVYSLALASSELRVGGDFRSLGGTPRMSLGSVALTTGSSTSWDPRAGGAVLALAKGAGVTFAGGTFASVNGQMRSNLAAFDTSTRRLTSFRPNPTAAQNEWVGPGGEIDALVISGGTLYAGGDFTRAAGESRASAAAFDTATGAILPWHPDVSSSVRPAVLALAASGGSVAIGGAFRYVGGVDRRGLAKVDATSGALMAFDAQLDGSVRALALSGGTLYAAGPFGTAGGALRHGLAAFDLANAAMTPFSPDASGIYALAVAGPNLYVGGYFNTLASEIGGSSVERRRLGSIDRSTGTVTAWNPAIDVSSTNAYVNALAVDGAHLYVGGSFDHVGAETRINLASVDTTTGAVTSWSPRTSGKVLALGLGPDAVHVGGSFSSVRSGHLWVDQRGIAQYAGAP